MKNISQQNISELSDMKARFHVAADVKQVETLAVVVEEQRLRIDSIIYGQTNYYYIKLQTNF